MALMVLEALLVTTLMTIGLKLDGDPLNNDRHQVGDFHQTSMYNEAYKHPFRHLVERAPTGIETS